MGCYPMLSNGYPILSHVIQCYPMLSHVIFIIKTFQIFNLCYNQFNIFTSLKTLSPTLAKNCHFDISSQCWKCQIPKILWMLSMFHLHGKHWDVVFDHNRQVTMFSLSCNLASYIQWGNEKVPFLAVQNSSIGDLVTHSLTDSLSEWVTFDFDITEWP